MGLAERRAIQAFESNRLPEFQQEIDQAARFEVALDVKWQTLAVEEQSHLYDECWTKIYFAPLIAAFAAICQDEMGQDALKAALKQVTIQNTGGIYYGNRWATFQDGILNLDHEPTTNADDVAARTNGLIKVLEAAL